MATCRASTQVTTTTLQKNLTEKIKWYIKKTLPKKNVGKKYLSIKKYLSTKKNICQQKKLLKKIWPKFAKCFFPKTVIDQNSQNMFFPKIGRMTKIHKMCFSENRPDEVSEKCARPAGQRKIVGFCVHSILQGVSSREIRICPTTKMSCFDKMSEFFRRHHFSAKHILCASAFFRVYEMWEHTFLPDTKNVHKIPKCEHEVIG